MTPAAPPSPRIILVGHCGPDARYLQTIVERAIPGARVERVDDEKDVAPAAAGATLLLINRALDGHFSAKTGIDLIRTLTASPTGDRPALMLISNVDDAQSEAQSAGALPGFGKSNAYSEEATARLRAAAMPG